MFYVPVVAVALASLTISFLAFALPGRYVRLVNYCYDKIGFDRRLQPGPYQGWLFRISNFGLFLMLLFCCCRYLWMIIHR